MMFTGKKSEKFSRHTSMDIWMNENPAVINILVKNRMHCVGCLLAPFHDLSDAAFEHGLDEYALLQELQEVTA